MYSFSVADDFCPVSNFLSLPVNLPRPYGTRVSFSPRHVEIRASSQESEEFVDGPRVY